MNINVRVTGTLAQKVGVPRVLVRLTPPVQVQDLLHNLADTYPQIAAELAYAVVVVGGVIRSKSAEIAEGQEVALVLPVAGGRW